ncbi:MAG: HAD family hydrolase [Pseudomonadota bacterium]
MKRPAVFMDRDGTINEQMGYINHVSRFKILPGVGDAIKRLNESDYLAVVVSNQSGVGRGYFPIDLVYEVHACLETALEAYGARVDGIFFCPHYPGGDIPEFSVDCDCRKPRTGLIEQAGEIFDIDLSRSFVVGDRCTDMELAKRCRMKGILVKTGYGLGDLRYILPSRPFKPAFVADDLGHAVRWILEGEALGGK